MKGSRIAKIARKRGLVGIMTNLRMCALVAQIRDLNHSLRADRTLHRYIPLLHIRRGIVQGYRVWCLRR